MSFDAWVEKRMQELRTLGADYAKAKAQVEYIDEFKKTKLAMLMQEAEAKGHKTAVAQEREARTHPEYIDLLDSYRAAVEVAEKCRWELKVAEIGVEVWRTQQANERNERKGYGA